MKHEVLLNIQQQLSAIICRLDKIENKIDRISLYVQLKQEECMPATEMDRIKEVQEKLSEALVRERAKAVAGMNENS
ncbi:MAG: hypothetical protein PHF56_03125 [Desulfuromonadaceae bacterium]|nr:hypothetical protein [Desulfuromonadaceae bacterium]